MKSTSDLEEEILEVSEAKGNSFNHFDFVVNPFQHTGVYGILTMS